MEKDDFAGAEVRGTGNNGRWKIIFLHWVLDQVSFPARSGGELRCKLTSFFRLPRRRAGTTELLDLFLDCHPAEREIATAQCRPARQRPLAAMPFTCSVLSMGPRSS